MSNWHPFHDAATGGRLNAPLKVMAQTSDLRVFCAEAAVVVRDSAQARDDGYPEGEERGAIRGAGLMVHLSDNQLAFVDGTIEGAYDHPEADPKLMARRIEEGCLTEGESIGLVKEER